MKHWVVSILTLDRDIIEIQIFGFVQSDLVDLFGLLQLLWLFIVIELVRLWLEIWFAVFIGAGCYLNIFWVFLCWNEMFFGLGFYHFYWWFLDSFWMMTWGCGWRLHACCLRVVWWANLLRNIEWLKGLGLKDRFRWIETVWACTLMFVFRN